MKHWMLAVALICLEGSAHAQYASKLDVAPDFAAFGARSFLDNSYIGGVQKPIWVLTKSTIPELSVDAWVAGGTAVDVLGGVQLQVPGVGLDHILRLFSWSQTAAKYAAYFQTGINIGYDPARIHGFKPAFLGYAVSVSVP